MVPKKNWNINGHVFGRLTVIEPAGKAADGRTLFKCLCECGRYATVLGKLLVNGMTRSCGCLKSDLTAKRNQDNGDAYGMAKSLTYNSWAAMIARCNNPKNIKYHAYGGRGIRVCVAWLDFLVFIQDMGLRPGRRFTLDRIENEGNYEPSNCRWATVKQQQRNRRCNRVVKCMGRMMTIAEVCELSEMPDSTLSARLDRGISIEEALSYRI